MDLKPEQIVLFTNATKKSENQPDMKGEAQCLCEHCHRESKVEVVMWAKTTSAGKPFLSGKIKKAQENEWTKKKQEGDAIAKQEYIKPAEDKVNDLPF